MQPHSDDAKVRKAMWRMPRRAMQKVLDCLIKASLLLFITPEFAAQVWIGYYTRTHRGSTADQADHILTSELEREENGLYSAVQDDDPIGRLQELAHQEARDNPLIARMRADETYCSEHVRPYDTKQRYLAIRSPCGTGEY